MINLIGTSDREFIHADELADASIFLMNQDQVQGVINVGKKISIHHLAELVKRNLDFHGTIIYDPAKPDIMMSRSLDTTSIHNLGWHSTVKFESGLREVCRQFEIQALVIQNKQRGQVRS